MRKILFLGLLVFFTFSCQQSEFEYSCDPVINKFVADNKEALSTITVLELSSYDFQLQKAIFSSWDYGKKRSAWVEKLQYVLVHIPFTETEKDHIQTLIDHLDEDYFLKENLDKNLEIRSQFASQWINFAVTNLGWSDQFIAFMVYRLYTAQSQFDSELSVLKSMSTINSTNSEGDCNCNVSADFCGAYFDCHSGGCSISTGCGWLLSMPCDGRCY